MLVTRGANICPNIQNWQADASCLPFRADYFGPFLVIATEFNLLRNQKIKEGVLMHNNHECEEIAGQSFRLINRQKRSKEVIYIPFDAIINLDDEIAQTKNTLFVGTGSECFDYAARTPSARAGHVASTYILTDGRCVLMLPHHHDDTARIVLPPAMVPETHNYDTAFRLSVNAHLMPLYSKAIRVQMYPDGIGVTIDMACQPNIKQVESIREYYDMTDRTVFVAEIKYNGLLIAKATAWHDFYGLIRMFPTSKCNRQSLSNEEANNLVYIEIKNRTGKVVLSGDYVDLKAAVKDNQNILPGADLRSAYLSSACLEDDNIFQMDPVIVDRFLVGLPGINLQGADLSGADLSNANLFNANLEGANMQGAKLQGAILCYANLKGANMQDANLCRVNLRRSNMSGAEMGGADLGLARMDEAMVSGTNLSNAKLIGTNMTGVNLEDANIIITFTESISNLTRVAVQSNHDSLSSCSDDLF